MLFSQLRMHRCVAFNFSTIESNKVTLYDVQKPFVKLEAKSTKPILEFELTKLAFQSFLQEKV